MYCLFFLPYTHLTFTASVTSAVQLIFVNFCNLVKINFAKPFLVFGVQSAATIWQECRENKKKQ